MSTSDHSGVLARLLARASRPAARGPGQAGVAELELGVVARTALDALSSAPHSVLRRAPEPRLGETDPGPGTPGPAGETAATRAPAWGASEPPRTPLAATDPARGSGTAPPWAGALGPGTDPAAPPLIGAARERATTRRASKEANEAGLAGPPATLSPEPEPAAASGPPPAGDPAPAAGSPLPGEPAAPGVGARFASVPPAPNQPSKLPEPARAESPPATTTRPPRSPTELGDSSATTATPVAAEATPAVLIDRIDVITPPAPGAAPDPFASLAARRKGLSRHAEAG